MPLSIPWIVMTLDCDCYFPPDNPDQPLSLLDLGPVPLLRCSASATHMSPITEQTSLKFSVFLLFQDPG